MTRYAELDQLLHHAKTRKPVPSRKIGNNTYAQRRPDGAIAIRLHDTDILTFWSTPQVETIRLDSGGWLTVTTEDRMNTYLDNWRICSDSGRWRLYVGTVPYRWYQDGITLRKDREAGGTEVLGGMTPEVRVRADRHNIQMMRLIDRYLRAWNDEKHAAMLSNYAVTPDCGLCVLLPEGLVGETMDDKQHLIEHLMDKTLHRSVWLAATSAPAPGDTRRGLNRLAHRKIAVHDLRNYLRSQLYLHHVATRRSRLDIT